MEKLQVIFDGYRISDILDVTRIERGTSSKTIQLSKIGVTNGKQFDYLTNDELTISTAIQLRFDSNQKREILTKILNVKEPKKLIFSDEPTKEYYAIAKGDIKFTGSEYKQTGTIEWVIPSGVAHSSIRKQFPATLNSSGILEVNIQNDGTDAVPVDYFIHMNHENGYIGIVGEEGVIQVGKVEELDIDTAEKSEWLINDFANSLSNWSLNRGYVPILDSQFKANGTWQIQANNGTNYLNWNSIGSGSQYHGVTNQTTFQDSNGDTSAKNWSVSFRLWFANSQVEGGGVQSIILANQDGSYRTGLMIQKDKRYANTFKWKAYDGLYSGFGATKSRKTSTADNALAESQNKLTAWKNGNFQITKKDKKVTFKFPDGGVYEINDSDNTIDYTNITIMSGGHGTSTPVKRMGWVYVKFRKDNVEYEYDVPNRFSANSDVEIDGSTTSVKQNGVDIAPAKGSKFFLAQPGNTKIHFFYSDFSNPIPDVVAEIREGF